MKRPFVVYGILGILLIVCSRHWFPDWWLHRENPLGMAETESAPGQVYGVLDKIEQKDSGTWYYLKECTVVPLGGTDKKSRETGGILVKTSYSVSETNHRDDDAENIILGAVVQAEGKLRCFPAPSNPGQFNSQAYYAQRNFFYQMEAERFVVAEAPAWTIAQTLQDIRAHLAKQADALWEDEDAGILKAMLLGDKSGITDETQSLYTKSGIGHLLAISGLHMTIFAMGMFGFLLFLRMPPRLAAGISVCVLFLYGYMTGLSVATNRAMLMMTLLFLAKILGRTFDRKNALGFAALVILWQSPSALYGSSFLLSFGAMSGVCYVCPLYREMLLGEERERRRRRLYKKRLAGRDGGKRIRFHVEGLGVKIAESFAFSLGIQTVVLPLQAWFYFEIPVYGVFLNLLVIPMMSVLLVSAAAGILLGEIWMPLGKAAAWMSHIILQLYDKICRTAAVLPGNRIVTGQPEWWQMALYYALLAAVCVCWHFYVRRGKCNSMAGKPEQGKSAQNYIEERRLRRRRCGRRVACIVGTLLLTLLLFRGNPRGFAMTFLDVGQGDCIFFQSEEGSTYLVDGGSSSVSEVGKYRILPFLKSMAVQKLDYVWITHLDEDHMSGILELLSMEDGISVGTLFLSETSFRDASAEALLRLCERRRVAVRVMARGDSIQEGQLSVECLYPSGVTTGEYDKNEWSQVLCVRYGEVGILLTGDLGAEGEASLLAADAPGQVDVLKAGHHGSKYSSSAAFLEALDARVAVFCAGKNNRYGHPHQETVRRVEECGMQWVTTADGGAVFLQTQGEGVQMWTYRSVEEKSKMGESLENTGLENFTKN